jgi:Zn-dependent protease with chaperone function
MQPHQAPLGVFVWEDRLFVLVSATQIGHPIDHPDDPGLLAWPWLVQHEAVHIRRGHLRSMFWVRHIHRMVYLATSAVFLFWCILPETPMLNALIRGCGAAWALAWLVQTGFCLGCEWKADRGATARMQDPAVLEETKKTLKRMTQIGAGPGSAVRWVIYALNVLLVDPHPPMRARLWLLNRRLRQLDNLRHRPSC